MNSVDTPIQVFCSFAPEDAKVYDQLHKHLRLFEREGVLTLKHHRSITPGTDWTKEIDEQLASASIILLLISPAFFASDYCYGVEMQCALQRHQAGDAHVIPMLIRSVDWQIAPFAHLSPLPTSGKPLAEEHVRYRDAAFTHVVTSLGRVIEEITSASINKSHVNTVSGIWNVPHRRNLHFTGRDELLDQLDQQLSPEKQDHSAATNQAAQLHLTALKGLGGIGKTQIAVEYAYRSRDAGRYIHILWINAADEEKLLTSFVKLADLLPAFPAKAKKDQDELIAAVKRWLEQCQQRWLLIFDNADDTALVRGYLPQQGKGSILLTTRAQAVSSLVASSIDVDTMGFVEGTHLLLRRVQRIEDTADEEINQAGNIVIALDHFPLALDQAGAYLEETQCSIADYLAIYQERRLALLERRGEPTTDYFLSVAATWSLSFQKVKQANPAAAELLQLCAFLAPERIPEELFKEGASYWPASLQHAAADRVMFNQMIVELLKFSLVKRLADDHQLSIHQLVQAVQIEMMASQERQQWANRVVQGVNKVFPERPDDATTWPQCLRYLDQVQACSSLIEQYTLLLAEGAHVLNRAGLYLDKCAFYTIAEALYQRALMINEQQTALNYNNLAEVYRKKGKYEQAEALYQRALKIFEQISTNYENIASCLNNLGLLYNSQEQYQSAEAFYQRALNICEEKLEKKHSLTAGCLNNLANLYYAQEKYQDAEPLYRHALEIWGWSEGSTHPDMALCLNNLAQLYYAQGKYQDAEPLYKSALAISKKWLGDEHPDTAHSLNNLALLYHVQEVYKEAEPLYKSALAIFEQTLGDGHYTTATCLNNLANLYYRQEQYEDAEYFLRRSLSSYEQVWGKEHPYTQEQRKRYVALLRTLGRDEEASQLEVSL